VENLAAEPWPLLVLVQARSSAVVQALVQFDVENLKAQGLSGANFIRMAGKPGGVMVLRTDDQSN